MVVSKSLPVTSSTDYNFIIVTSLRLRKELLRMGNVDRLKRYILLLFTTIKFVVDDKKAGNRKRKQISLLSIYLITVTTTYFYFEILI